MQKSQKYLDINLKYKGTNNSGHTELVTWVKDCKVVTGVRQHYSVEIILYNYK